jgi:hypothetical protein
MTRINKN